METAVLIKVVKLQSRLVHSKNEWLEDAHVSIADLLEDYFDLKAKHSQQSCEFQITTERLINVVPAIKGKVGLTVRGDPDNWKNNRQRVQDFFAFGSLREDKIRSRTFLLQLEMPPFKTLSKPFQHST